MRFPEFKDKLSNVKLSALFKKCTQKNKYGQVTNVICNSAKNGLVPQRDFFDKDIANAENTAGYYIIQKQDFVYNPRKSNEAPYGPISMYKYEEDGIVSPLYLCFRSTEPLCANFFETYFKSSAWHRYIYLMGDSGARHDRVSIKDEVFFDMPINIPALPEQEKIAEFLSLVEERIEQQRQLVEALKRYKRGLFISIYSANYSHWHQAKIRDYSKALGGYAFDSKSYNDDGIYKVITIGNVSGNKYIDTSNTNKVPEIPTDMQPHQILQNGDIVISMTGNVGRVSVVNQLNCLLNQRVAKLDIKDVLVKEYIYQILSNSDFEQEMNNVGQGAAQKNIKNTDIENYVFYIPQTDQHIETFTTILKKLDENIMHQDMIYFMLKRTKQALLQQMFI